MTRILLIDLSSVAYPLWHTSQGDPDPNATSTKTIARVRALASGQAHVAVCCDSGRSFRHDLNADYKAQRPAQDATLRHQLSLACEALKADGFPVWSVPGFEADDLIASAVRYLVDRAQADSDDPQPGIVVASADKDLLQLVGPRVTVHSLTTGNELDEAAVVAKLGVSPNQVRDYLSLVGDASDNIKGAEGIGPKTAAALLQKFGNLEDVYAELAKAPQSFKPSTVKSLTEFRGRMADVRALVTLREDVPLSLSDIFHERVAADTAAFTGENMATETANEEQPQVPLPEPDAPAPAADAAPYTPVLGPAIVGPGTVYDSSSKAAEAARYAQEQQRGLTVRTPDALPLTDVRWQLEPRSMPEAIQLANHMHASRLFSAYGTPQGVLSTILAGRELGMQAMASLRAFHIIDSKPTMSADLIRALVMKSGHAEYFRCTERAADHATFVTKRRGDPEVSLTFTIAEGRTSFVGDDAKWSKSGWGRNPADMLVARASSKLARLVYADVVFNMYAPEELD